MSYGIRQVEPDSGNFLYYAVATMPGGYQHKRGPYGSPGTASGAIKQALWRRDAEIQILRVRVSEPEPYLTPAEELIHLRARVSELEFRLAGLEK